LQQVLHEYRDPLQRAVEAIGLKQAELVGTMATQRAELVNAVVEAMAPQQAELVNAVEAIDLNQRRLMNRMDTLMKMLADEEELAGIDAGGSTARDQYVPLNAAWSMPSSIAEAHEEENEDEEEDEAERQPGQPVTVAQPTLPPPPPSTGAHQPPVAEQEGIYVAASDDGEYHDDYSEISSAGATVLQPRPTDDPDASGAFDLWAHDIVVFTHQGVNFYGSDKFTVMQGAEYLEQFARDNLADYREATNKTDFIDDCVDTLRRGPRLFLSAIGGGKGIPATDEQCKNKVLNAFRKQDNILR
jgi:hypothetical protein